MANENYENVNDQIQGQPDEQQSDNRESNTEEVKDEGEG